MSVFLENFILLHFKDFYNGIIIVTGLLEIFFYLNIIKSLNINH